MKYEDILKKYFDRVFTEADFVEKTYTELNKFGFNAANTIACVGVCRDEISQSLIEEVNKKWGYAFNLSSLAGMFFAGKTGLMAAMHHSPIVEGKERYVFYAMPHIAIDAEGRIGVCKRIGREGESTACGALNAFQKELSSASSLQSSAFSLNNEDIEYSLIKIRLSKEISSGKVPNLLELTKITQQAIQQDLENTIKSVVETKKSDFAVITGIQIHGTDGNYVSSTSCYTVVNGEKVELRL